MADGAGAITILQSKSLPGAVKDAIANLIILGELTAGQRLTEAELALRLGVSRGPVREALLGLEEAGLIRHTKNRGVTVREITPREAAELYDVRASLESLAGRILAPRVTQAQIATLRGMVVEMTASTARADMGTYFPQNVRFHDIIVEFADNQRLLAIYRRLINEMHLMRRHEMVKSQGMAVSSLEHAAIVDALESRSSPAASAAIEAHVMGGRRRLLAILGGLEGGEYC